MESSARRGLESRCLTISRPIGLPAGPCSYRKHVTNPIDLLDAHRGRIMEKLDVHSIDELVRFAVRNGLID